MLVAGARIWRAVGRLAFGVGAGVALRGAAVVTSVANGACACPASGMAVVLEPDVLERGPTFGVAGTCEPANVSCLGRDRADRCATYWIDPRAGGTCHVVVTLADGARLERTIELEVDEAYPCRGNVRPREDGALRIGAL